MDWIEPRTCIDENLTVDDNGHLCMRPWAVPRLVRDVKVNAISNKKLPFPQINMPGLILLNQQFGWVNDSMLPVDIQVTVFRSWKEWVTSNPNIIQFRDRWTSAIDTEPDEPVTTGTQNGQTGSGIDLGSNTVAEPMPGVQTMWMNANMSDEWIYSILPGEKFNIWYRCYVWTPQPWSDNANKNSPRYAAYANFARISLVAHPSQGSLVSG